MAIELWHPFAAGHQAAVCGWVPYRRQAQWHGKFGRHSQDIYRQLWKGWERFAGGRSGLLSACVELNYVWCISMLVGFYCVVPVLLKSVVLWNMMLGQLTVHSWHFEGTWCIHIEGHVVKFLLHDRSLRNTVSYPGTVECSLQYCPVVYRVTVCEHKCKLGSVTSSLQYVLITSDSPWTCYVHQWCYHFVTYWARIALAMVRTVWVPITCWDRRFFLSPKLCRPSVGPSQPPVQWELGNFPGSTAAKPWSSM